MVSKLFILSLLGLIYLQVTQSQASTTVPTSPYIPSSIFYDCTGNSVLNSNYPFYDSFSYRPPKSLISDYTRYQQLSLYSAVYNVPITHLFQLYSIIDANMPRLPTDLDLNMIQNLAQAMQEERIRDIINPNLSVLCPTDPAALTLNQLNDYWSADIPTSYRYMFLYMNSLIPSLSPQALLDIQNSVYNNTPPSMIAQADQLTFQLQASIRFMLASQMHFIPSY